MLIRENKYQEPVINLDYLVPPESRPSFEELSQFEVPLEWCAIQDEEMGKDHSQDHAARVLIWANMHIAYAASRGIEIPFNSQLALNCFAAFHDSQRWDDGDDFEHGERAALEAARFYDGRVPPEVLKEIQYLCRAHVPHDNKQGILGPLSYIAKMAKDSDLLDRNRGCNDLDRKYIRLPITHAFIHYARQLHELSLEMTDGTPFQRVMKAALQLGLLRG